MNWEKREQRKRKRAADWADMVEADSQNGQPLTPAERESLLMAGPTHVRILVRLLKEQRRELNYLWGLHPDGKPRDAPWVDQDGDTTDVAELADIDDDEPEDTQP